MADFIEILNSRPVRSVSINDAVCMDANGKFDKNIGIAFCQNLMGGTWIASSDYVPPPIDEAEARRIIAEHMDNVVRARGYFSIGTACAWVDSDSAIVKAQAEACVKWRDQIGDKVRQILYEIATGLRPVPTQSQLISEMPAMQWPMDGTGNGTLSG